MDNHTASAYGKMFMIPQSPEDREFLLSVDRRARDEVYRKYGILVDYDWQANTITNAMVEAIILTLATLVKGGSKGIGLDFYDIIQARVSIKENNKAEKEGNINICFDPGARCFELLGNGPDTTEYVEKLDPAVKFTTGNPKEDGFYAELERVTRNLLSSKHGIMILDHLKFSVFAIGYTFLECIYLELFYRLSNMDAEEGEEKLVSVNFNDYIEIHGVMRNGNVDVLMRPGAIAKLGIKSDETTENTMGDME